MNIISNWIKNIVIYMILNTIIMNLLGNSRYKKYVSIVSGLILVMIVITPLLKILHLDDELDYNIRSKEFAVEAADFKNSLSLMEKSKIDLIFKDYKEKMQSQVEEIAWSQELYLVTCNIDLDNDPDSEGFGEIISMDLVLSEKLISEGVDHRERIIIEEVRIARIKPNEKNDIDFQEKLYSPAEIKMKIKLSDFYNIPTDNINISIERDG